MTSLLEGARKLVGRHSDLGTRVQGLENAVEIARGRLDDASVDDAAAVVERASARLRIAPDHTVVALAGATGSGKSSTFNRLTGLDLAAVGVRRPTTSWATACTWGAAGAVELLEWLGIPARHQVSRDSMLDTGRDARSDHRDFRGLVLLDLPDHDSTEVSHHLEVDRLVQMSDLMVWVLDPQKYADASIHDDFLKPLAAHKDLMVVVLNHIDEVPSDRREGMLADVRRLLDLDGLAGVPVLATSARDGDGIEELRRTIADKIADKKAAGQRLGTDVAAAASRLSKECGTTQPNSFSRRRQGELIDAVADAAGVPTVVDAVERSTRQRARRATGWPITSWFSRLRPDPLKRLHLELGSSGRELLASARSSVPEATPVQRARVDASVRAVGDEVTRGMNRPWVESVRRASVSRMSDLNDELDQAVTGTDIGASGIPLWCHLVRVLQWLLLLAAIGGAVWLGALAVSSYLQLSLPDAPEWEGLPIPTLMLIGGVVLGIGLALVCRALVGYDARSRARTADRRLRKAVGGVTERLVIVPVEGEIEAYQKTRACLQKALG